MRDNDEREKAVVEDSHVPSSRTKDKKKKKKKRKEPI
jgi:hypothetical protein